MPEKIQGIVNIASKSPSERIAIAGGSIILQPKTIEQIKLKQIVKGDVLEIARVAGINAVKKTADIIPLCHQLLIEGVTIVWDMGEDNLDVRVEVNALAKTGVEMEALAGVTAALLTVWDMVKYLEKDEQGQYPTARIEGIRVIEKIKRIPDN